MSSRRWKWIKDSHHAHDFQRSIQAYFIDGNLKIVVQLLNVNEIATTIK